MKSFSTVIWLRYIFIVHRFYDSYVIILGKEQCAIRMESAADKQRHVKIFVDLCN